MSARVRETANRGKVRRDVTQFIELEARESIISPFVRPQLPPLAMLVLYMRRLLQGKAPIEREREETRAYQPVLERRLRKGREGLRLLHDLYFDEQELFMDAVASIIYLHDTSECGLLVRRVLFGSLSPVIHSSDDFAQRFAALGGSVLDM